MLHMLVIKKCYVVENKYYNKGKRAKELVGLYKNPYEHGTYEHDEWRLGFDHGIQEPIDNDIQLDEDTFIDQFEPLKILDI